MSDKTWDVGVSAVVVRDERVLFVRYAYGHRKGMWTLPGGYAQHDETLDRAAARELEEEAGLRGEPRGIVSVRTRVTEEGGAVFVGFRIQCDEGEPVPDGHEVDAAQFFRRGELLTLNPVMELSRQIALAVLAAPNVELVETNVPGRSDQTYKAYIVR
jgi:ADP-ribose pyrophosphatase YjhB (NUDIX family)